MEASEKGRPHKGHVAAELDEKLWAGFSLPALHHLEQLCQISSVPGEERRKAAWYIARWHMFRQDYRCAFEYASLMHELGEGAPLHKGQVLLEVDCLLHLGQAEEARKRLEGAMHLRQGDLDFCLAYANVLIPSSDAPTVQADALRLEWINRAFSNAGLSQIALAHPDAPLGIDNLIGLTSGAPCKSDIQVSVVVPVYRAQETLAFALSSLLAQSWTNLQIIVVDDCSPDGSFEIAREFQLRDPRVLALRQVRNQGAYAARNRGLEAATGALITTHDADDWSHPLKIELQVDALRNSPGALANHADWARVLPNLRFTGSFRPTHTLVQKDLSSTLYHREVFDQLGAWDDVRVAADDELIWRLRTLAGSASIQRVLKGVPLAFSLNRDDSLTRAGPTHVRSVFFGVRRDYCEAAWHWHATSAPDGLRLVARGVERSFPAPGIILPQSRGVPDCDLLIVTDLSVAAGTLPVVLGYLDAAEAWGLTSGVFHWPAFEFGTTCRMAWSLRQMAQEGRIVAVSAGESLFVRKVLAFKASTFLHPLDAYPNLELDRLAVIVDGEAAWQSCSYDRAFDPLEVRGILHEAFGTEGTWVAESEPIKKVMECDRRYPAPHYETWPPLVSRSVRIAGAASRGMTERRPPVIGRHGCCGASDWPASPDERLSVYCAYRECRTEILGGGRFALHALDTCPPNWIIHCPGDLNAGAFPERLDFFVHYPRADRPAGFDHPILEAMAVGCPVILPRQFEPLFGTAALYAEPAEVWEIVRRFWSVEELYQERRSAARSFVSAHCSFDVLSRRLTRLDLAPTGHNDAS